LIHHVREREGPNRRGCGLEQVPSGRNDSEDQIVGQEDYPSDEAKSIKVMVI
jgi:hypothetical protein